MEMTGINEAAQLINVSINGISTTLKLTGSFLNWNLNQLKSVGKLISSVIQKKNSELKPGEMNFGDMLTKLSQNGMKPAMYNIDNNIINEVTDKLKEMKVPYSIFPDLNNDDGVGQIVIPDQYKSSMLGLANHYNVYEGPESHIAISRTSLQEYVQNGDPSLIEQLTRDAHMTPEQKEIMDDFTKQGYEQLGDLDRWDDLRGEVLVVNNVGGNGEIYPDQEQDVIQFFKDNDIIATRIPNDSNGRSCFLFDSDKSLIVRESFNDSVIQVSDYMDNIDDNALKNEWFKNNKNMLDNLQKRGISNNILNNGSLSEDIVIDKNDLDKRIIGKSEFSIKLKVLDSNRPPSECYCNIPINRISKDKDGNFHIKLLSKENIYLGYDKDINSKFCNKSNFTVISGRNVKQFSDNLTKSFSKTKDKSVVIESLSENIGGKSR